MRPKADTMTPGMMLFQRIKDGTSDVDWSEVTDQVFEVQNTLQVMLKEAGLKGCWVILTAALVPVEDLLPLDDDAEAAVGPDDFQADIPEPILNEEN